MTIISNERVPKNKMKMWHEILCATGGYYLKNPIEEKDYFKVTYAPGDYKKQWQSWKQVTTKIVEKRSDTFIKTIIRRFILIFKINNIKIT